MFKYRSASFAQVLEIYNSMMHHKLGADLDDEITSSEADILFLRLWSSPFDISPVRGAFLINPPASSSIWLKRVVHTLCHRTHLQKMKTTLLSGQ